jgi:branched-chain amino acid transport system substrate-binding protein
MNSPAFWQIAGTAGEGTLFTSYPDFRKGPAAQNLVKSLAGKGDTAESFTLLSYAAVEIFAQAAGKANSTKLEDLSAALHGATFQTVLGAVGFDGKGDAKGINFVLWRWHDGAPAPL